MRIGLIDSSHCRPQRQKYGFPVLIFSSDLSERGKKQLVTWSFVSLHNGDKCFQCPTHHTWYTVECKAMWCVWTSLRSMLLEITPVTLQHSCIKVRELDWQPLETLLGVSDVLAVTDKFHSMSLQVNNQTTNHTLSLSAQGLKNSHWGKIPEKQPHGGYELRVLIPTIHWVQYSQCGIYTFGLVVV